MVNNRRNHYRMLFVQPDAARVIRANYRTLMRKLKLHPDLGGEHWNAVYVNEAYATLQDPLRRAAYDIELLKHYDIATLSRGSLHLKNDPHQSGADNTRNFYRILQVQPDAPTVVIEASHRALMDQGTVPAAQLQEAFATLRDPVRRRIYDRLLEEGDTSKRWVAHFRSWKADLDQAASQHQHVVHPASGYEPLITRYCLFCKTTNQFLGVGGGGMHGMRSRYSPARGLSRSGAASVGQARSAKISRFTFCRETLRGRMLDLSPTGLRLLTPKVCEIGDINRRCAAPAGPWCGRPISIETASMPRRASSSTPSRFKRRAAFSARV